MSEGPSDAWDVCRPDDPLTPLEVRVRDAASTGELVDVAGERPLKPQRLPQLLWGDSRSVRAAVLRYLLIGGSWPVDPKGVRLRGVRVSGLLDLEGATVTCPLR